jgi:hypothetical protein
MSPHAKRLIDEARAADVLAPHAHERMLRGLTTKLARGEMPLPDIDASPLLVSKAGWLVKLSSSLAAKVGLSVLGALLIAAGVMLLRREAPPQPAVIATARPAPVAAVPLAPAEPTATVRTEPAKATSAPASREPRATALRGERVRRSASARAEEEQARDEQPQLAPERELATDPELAPEPQLATAPEPEPEPQPREAAQLPAPATTLDDELPLLRRAYSELNAGRPERAFEVLDVHAARFPHGELEEAREVARMLALCAMGKAPAAKGRARQFLALHPDSPFAGRVRGICPAKKAP